MAILCGHPLYLPEWWSKSTRIFLNGHWVLFTWVSLSLNSCRVHIHESQDSVARFGAWTRLHHCWLGDSGQVFHYSVPLFYKTRLTLVSNSSATDRLGVVSTWKDARHIAGAL
jgi:hypothetical protein